MALAEQTGLPGLVADKVVIKQSRVPSAGVNPVGKLAPIVAGMVAGADTIDDLEVIRSPVGCRWCSAVWRYHPFFTKSTEPTAAADITHRRHAITETVFADLIDGPLAHLPSGSLFAVELGRYIAEQIHGARLATAPGTDMVLTPTREQRSSPRSSSSSGVQQRLAALCARPPIVPSEQAGRGRQGGVSSATRVSPPVACQPASRPG